ncbi:MAG: hypothetical protein AB7G12_09115 [Thermoanaerobaculia bacterium]
MSVRSLTGAVVLLVLLAPGRSWSDERTDEVVRRDCSTELGRNELTLFANGTIRLREWRGEESSMRLAELGRDELEAFRRRLDASDPGERRSPPSGVSGEWVERCDLEVGFSDGGRRSFRYGRLDTHQLAFASFLRLVDELAGIVSERAETSTLPADYTPRRGDVLLRRDGVAFEVVGFTVVGEGVELRGVVDPLTIYIAKSDLRSLFDRLERSGP